jgi:chaperonin GroES
VSRKTRLANEAKRERAMSENASKIEPCGNMVLLRIVPKDKTEGGLHVPHSAQDRSRAIVLAVGPGRVTDHGERIPVGVKPGDRVLFGQAQGLIVERHANGLEDVLVNESDILAKDRRGEDLQ